MTRLDKTDLVSIDDLTLPEIERVFTLAFALELVPGADLFPTWTAVVASIPARDELARAAIEEPTVDPPETDPS